MRAGVRLVEAEVVPREGVVLGVRAEEEELVLEAGAVHVDVVEVFDVGYVSRGVGGLGSGAGRVLRDEVGGGSRRGAGGGGGVRRVCKIWGEERWRWCRFGRRGCGCGCDSRVAC